MKRFGFLALIVAVTLLHGALAMAAPFDITTADGNGADTYVDTALYLYHGAEDNMIAWGDAGNNMKIYVRFDLASITRSLADATLTCTTIDGQFRTATTLWGLNDGDAGETWDEHATAAPEAPANDQTDGTNFLANATYLGVFGNIGAGAGATGDFSGAALKNFLDADTDGLATLMFASPNGFTYLASKENTNGFAPPTLTVEEDATSPTRFFITTDDGNGADAYIQETFLYRGADADLIAWGNAGQEHKIYVRFDLSAFSTAVEAARLTCTTIDGQFKPGTTVWGLNDGDPGESWNEYELADDNAPANDTTDGTNFLANATYLGVFENIQEGTAGGTGGFSGDALKDFLNADTDNLVTLMFASPNGYTDMAAREHATLAPPTLFLKVAGYHLATVLVLQ